uniref:Uncharacterized protein n=1 Tax=Panagrolaimus sp. JU765 TaxID=591449 RepID=A0AC34Q968_9BILA
SEEYKASLIPETLQEIYNKGISSKLTPLGSPTTPINPKMTINEIPYSLLIDSKINKFVCSLTTSEDIFIVVKIERLLSDCPSDVYGKTAIEPKQFTKMKNIIKTSCLKLARFKCPFAWTAGPLFATLSKPGFPTLYGGWQLFKNEGKLIDADLQKYLIDCI